MRSSPDTTSFARHGCGCSGRATRSPRNGRGPPELLYPWMVRSPGRTPAFARSFFGRNLDPDDPALSHRPRWDSTAAIKGLLCTDMRNEIDLCDTVDVVSAMPAGSKDWDSLSRAQWIEMTTLLAGYILSSQGDRMLMANSVEGRFPFLDRDVVDFANQLPARHKLFGLEEKYLLKLAFADLVSDEILTRPKQPYRAPDAASFFAEGGSDWFGDVTSERPSGGRRVRAPRWCRTVRQMCKVRWREHEQHRQHAGTGDRLHPTHVRELRRAQ